MQGETVVVIATRVWHSLWRNTQQILSRIAAQNRVLYFEPGRDPDRPYLAEARRNARHIGRPRPQHVHERLTLIPTPPCLPYVRRQLPAQVLRVTTPLVAAVNAQILTRHVRRSLRLLDAEASVLWLYEPRHLGLLGAFGERLACYYSYDELADLPRNTRIRAALRRYDDELSRRADIVFVSSRAQLERRLPLNPHTHLIPNGVDYALFSRALDPATPLAPELAALPRPIIGLVGWLGNQLDPALLARLAEERPGWSLALVGPDCLPEGEHSRRLRELPNVRFLGRQPLTRLPEFLRGIDVALIPYIVGGHTLAVYPLKLHEYLAAGRPVVATALPELRPYADVVRVAETHDAFIEAVGAALAEGEGAHLARRLEVARANTWERRVERVYEALDQHPKLRRKEQRDEDRARGVVAL